MNSHDKSLVQLENDLPQRPIPVGGPLPGYGPEQEEPGIDPLQLLSYVLRHRWVIGTIFLCCLVAGVVYTWMQTPIYRAQTTVEILTDSAKALDEIDAVESFNDARTFETQRTKLLSRDLARRVVFERDLSNNATFIAPQPSFSLRNLFSRALGTNTATLDMDAYSAEQRQNIAVARLQSALSADFIRGTSILRISFSHPDPGLSAAVANQVTESFIDQSVDQRGATSDLARQFIREQVEETQKRLEASEQALLEYAQAEGILLNTDENSLIAANISDVNDALSDLQQDLFIADLEVQQIDDGAAAALPQIVESNAINNARARLSELRARYQEKLATLKPAFPEMRQLSAQISETEAQIENDIEAISRSVRLKAEQLVQRRSTLQEELARLEQEQANFQRKNVRYTILQREVDSNRSQYETLIAKLNEVGVGADLRRANAAVIDSAEIPRSPISPSLSYSLILALGLAALISAMVVYVLELMNNTFSDPDQVENDLEFPVLGIIPATRPEDMEQESNDPVSAYSEAYRTLRTSIEFSATDQPVATYAITSSEPSEGKSTTVFKLASEFAGLGKRVLVIDADMRKSKMHRLFKTDNTIGLSNLLTNVLKSNVETPVFRKTGVKNVDFVPAGILPPNPVNLLASQRMALVIKFCADRYDVVLIDCPPIAGLADALILSRLADATLLVVSAKQVKRGVAKAAVKRLVSASANIIGISLTKFEVDRFDYYHAYKYMKYNDYTYGNETAQISGAGRAEAGVLGLRFNALRRLLDKWPSFGR